MLEQLAIIIEVKKRYFDVHNYEACSTTCSSRETNLIEIKQRTQISFDGSQATEFNKSYIEKFYPYYT